MEGTVMIELRTALLECVNANIVDLATANEMLEHFDLETIKITFNFAIFINGERFCHGTVDAIDEEEADDLVRDWFTDNLRTKVTFAIVDDSFNENIEFGWSEEVVAELDYFDERAFDLGIELSEA